jgi:glycosyltransferase involved in cell wall biosynthesis
MKTILTSTYAMNPYKGSEDGMGWNFVKEIARNNQVISVTRKNNQEQIDKFMSENPNELYKNIKFLYYDLPYFLRFWKKKHRGALLYYYLWQICLPIFLWKNAVKFDVVHNLNFHNDWTPSFLWVFGKPFIWGPIGHHPMIPKRFLRYYSFKTLFADRARWILKKLFWTLDPFLKISVAKANKVLVMNTSVEKVLKLSPQKMQLMRSVSAEPASATRQYNPNRFHVLSVGRFVALKGFDVAINSFARFYHLLDNKQQKTVKLTLVGRGSEKERLEQLIHEGVISECTEIVNWVSREKLTDLYSQADIFLFPSHEGAGMVVAEALSFGLPVLCFDNVGPGEQIDSSCGLKVPYSNYENCKIAFCAYLFHLYKNPDFHQVLSEGAIEKFNKVHSWSTKAPVLKNIYDEVCGLSLSHGDRTTTKETNKLKTNYYENSMFSPIE